MRQKLTLFFASRWGIVIAGAIIGILAPLLQHWGNPPNMGICVACFERDIAGALGLHRATAVQYLRPEIMGFVLGSVSAAVLFREWKARGGSAPMLRFVLGMFAMIGALAFLGCPWRALLRLAGGDLNAIIGIAGLSSGIAGGVLFLKNGYSLGRAHPMRSAAGWALPIMALALLALAIWQPILSKDGAIFHSTSGPGAMGAPIAISLGVGLLIGFLAQRTRFCTMGSLRDVILMGDTHLISGLGALVVFAFITNLLLGQFNPGYRAQPIAHSSLLPNFFGMVLAGLAFTLAGGCPGRQLILSGEGDSDAGVFVLGMLSGAAISHNMNLAGKPDSMIDGHLSIGGISTYGLIAIALGIGVCLAIGFAMRDTLNGVRS